jgi:hypothetical protein
MSTGSSGGRRPAVWLATVSTVVGVATGMFTLRDNIFPSEKGDAEAKNPSMSVYQHSVGEICDALNRNEAQRYTRTKRLGRVLPQQATVADQRDAVLQTVQQTLADSDNELSAFDSLDTPKTSRERHATTSQAWNRNADRLRRYTRSLRHADDQEHLFAAITRYADLDGEISRDGVVRDAGLQNLGGGSCRFDETKRTPEIKLPGLDKDVSPNSDMTQHQQSSTDSGDGTSETETTPTDTTPQDTTDPADPGDDTTTDPTDPVQGDNGSAMGAAGVDP